MGAEHKGRTQGIITIMIATKNFTKEAYAQSNNLVKINPSSVILLNDKLPVGVDLASKVFQVCYQLPDGSLVNKELKRKDFEIFIANRDMPMYFGMEGCSGCGYWTELIRQYGHEVRIMNASRIAARRGRHQNKDDRIDAEVIRCALIEGEKKCRPRNKEEIEIKKAFQQQDAIRKLLNTLTNQVRDLLINLGAYTITIRTVDDALKAIELYRKEHSLSTCENELFDIYQSTILGNCAIMDSILHSIIEPYAYSNPIARLLMSEVGFGVQTAALMAADIGELSRFDSARGLQAYCGLVPSHTGSGGKIRMGKMKHQGDRILKRLVYESALSICHLGKSNAPRSQWVEKILNRYQGAFKKGVLCIAAKLVRVAYGILVHQSPYNSEIDNTLGKEKQRSSRARKSVLKKKWRDEMYYADFSQYLPKNNAQEMKLDFSVSLNALDIHPGFKDEQNCKQIVSVLNRSSRISSQHKSSEI